MNGFGTTRPLRNASRRSKTKTVVRIEQKPIGIIKMPPARMTSQRFLDGIVCVGAASAAAAAGGATDCARTTVVTTPANTSDINVAEIAWRKRWEPRDRLRVRILFPSESS